MNESSSSHLLSLWQSALAASVGIVISTDDRVLLRQQLYRARAEAGVAELEQIVIIFTETEGELWLVKRNADS